MSKVLAFHTNSKEYPEATREVYHDHDDCFEGKKIKLEHKEYGTANKRRCKVCEKLG